MRAVTFQAPHEVRVDERPDAGAREPPRRDRVDRRQRHLRLGPAHLPRPREDGAGLHDRPRVRRHGPRRRRRRHPRRGRRPRPRLLPQRLRDVLLLPARRLPQVRPDAGVRPRRAARRAAGHPGRAGARADGRHDAAPGPRRRLRRRRPVRRRRDGHRLPRGHRAAASSPATASRCWASGRSGCAPCRWRSRPGAAPVLAIDSVRAAPRDGADLRRHPRSTSPRRARATSSRVAHRGARGRRGHRRRRASRRARTWRSGWPARRAPWSPSASTPSRARSTWAWCGSRR